MENKFFPSKKKKKITFFLFNFCCNPMVIFIGKCNEGKFLYGWHNLLIIFVKSTYIYVCIIKHNTYNMYVCMYICMYNQSIA